MTSDIRTTIVDALASLGFDADHIESNYAEHITTAETALLEREWSVTDQLSAIALRETEFNEEQLNELFEQVGLSVRPKPEPVVEELPAPVEGLSDSERIGNLEANMEKIIKSLGVLTMLAGKHLGSSAL